MQVSLGWDRAGRLRGSHLGSPLQAPNPGEFPLSLPLLNRFHIVAELEFNDNPVI
jgi:hypothetical protein